MSATPMTSTTPATSSPTLAGPTVTLGCIEVQGPWPIQFGWDQHQRTVTMTVERTDTITGRLGTAILVSRPLQDRPADSTLVRTAFGLYAAFCEHEAREAFQYAGRRVFGPHIAVEALWNAAASTEG